MSSATPRPEPSGLIGRTFDGLTVQALLGRGGMAEVWRAWDGKLARAVAVKILAEEDAKDRDFALRFEREARAASGISHPNIAHIYATGRVDGRPYYVMELVEGRSLAEILDADGRVAGLRGLDWLRQAAEGLRAAAQEGVIHRDIKPDNLMVDGRGVLKIVDFGLARRRTGDVRVTQTAVVVGTPRYMSPEQAKAEPLDERSDIYSLGACFYHLFAGEPPFDADTPVALMMKHVAEPLPPLKQRAPSVPASVAAIIEKMLAKRREDRYRDYDALLADVELARSGRLRTISPAPAAPPPRSVVRVEPPGESSRGWWVVPVLLLAAVGGGAYLYARSRAAQPEPAPPSAAIPASWNVNGMIGMALHTRTLATLKKLSTMCQVWIAEHDDAPERLDEIFDRFEVPPQERRDGWARPIRYERIARGKYRLISDGADGRPGTADDVVVENGFVVQGDLALPGVPTSRQQRGLDPPPPAEEMPKEAP